MSAKGETVRGALVQLAMLDILEAGLAGEKTEERPFYMAKNAALYGVDLNDPAR